MIWAIALLVVGVLLVVLPIVLRKKLKKSWMISLMAGGVLLGVSGGLLTAQQVQQNVQYREYLYLSLCYLERGETDSALFYIQKAESDDSYVAAAARGLLERMRDNDLMSRLYTDIAESEARSEAQKSLLTTLQAADLTQRDQVMLVTELLTAELKLSEERQADLQLFVQAEAGYDTEDLAGRLDETARQRLRVSAQLNQGNYHGAVQTAAALVDADPSADNRLLLAEAVAESAYNGYALSADAFAAQGAVELDESVQKERDDISRQLVELQSELQILEINLNGTKDEDTISKLNKEKLELTEQVNELTKKSEKLFVYRAFSAIADIRSLEAELVRARLYFALEDRDKAVETLLDAAQSLSAKMTADRTLANSLRIVETAYEEENARLDNQEFRDAVTQLLAAPFSDLMYISQSQLTVDFMERVVSDQKVYGDSLFVSGLDISDYPVVRVVLSGREEILKQVVEKSKEVVSRDTRKTVTYTAKFSEQYLTSVCVVVDESGSMGGHPMSSLKEALVTFVENADDETEISLVGFENAADKKIGLTFDKAALMTKVDALRASGGTNITAGIQAGTEVLSTAAGMRYMLLMTDGQSDIDFNVVDNAALQGITIHTIGFGSVNDALLEEIAQRTGGQYIKADSVSELSNVYASLQQVLGNTVTVEYTVEEDGEELRYFYLQTDDYSIRRDYTTEIVTGTTELYSSQPSIVSPDTLQSRLNQNGSLELTLTGQSLGSVASVTVGGKTAQITNLQDNSLRLTVSPELNEGWQTVTLTMEDGTQRSYDRLLLVGRSSNYRNVRLGSVTIQQAEGVLPGDGTLVLSGTGIRLNNTDSADSARMSMTMSGMLVLPWNIPDPAEGEALPTSNVDLGDSGVITGWGQLSLRSDDSAYDGRVPATILQGGVQMECSAEQCILIGVTEGGEQ